METCHAEPDTAHLPDSRTMIAEGPLLAGVLIGLSVTAPVGPMGVLCIQRTLAGGLACGLSTGLGATAIQLCYGTIFLLGLREFGPDLARTAHVLGVCGGLLMLWFGLRLLRRRVRLKEPRRTGPASLLLASTSAMALNACNPMLVLLMAGAVTAIAGPDAAQGSGAPLILLGLAAGSAGWWLALCGLVVALRTRLRPRMLDALNQVSAASLLGFGVFAIVRSACL